MTYPDPIVDSGTITGPNVRVQVGAKFLEKLAAIQSNSVQAWEQVWTDSVDKFVFHSVGDRNLGSGSNVGDTDLWVYIYVPSGDNGRFRLDAMQDFSPTDGYPNGCYRQAYETGLQVSYFDDSTTLRWWSIMSPYMVIFVWEQDGTYEVLWFGTTMPTFHDALSGVARITSQSGTGNGVTIGLDRDISDKIQVGQIVWLVNQTPDSTSIQEVGIDIVRVTAISSSQATVDGVTNTYAVGSLFGVDPAAMYIGNEGQYCYGTHNPDGSYILNNNQAYATIKDAAPGIVEADHDPDPNGLYWAFRSWMYHHSGDVNDGYRGQMLHVLRVANSDLTLSHEDILQIDYDSGNEWLVINAAWFGAAESQFAVAFGPGF